MASIVVTVPDGMAGPIHGGTSVDSYRLVSVPLDLDEQGARTVFESSLGPYDAAVWRLFALESGSSLVELNERELVLESGKAFWMLAHDTGRVFNTGSGTSVSTSEPFPIRLNREWNLVGNPFAFDIPVGNLSIGQDGPEALWRFDGTWTREETAFRPFEGYAVFGERIDTLWIDPDLSAENVQSNLERRRQTETDHVAQSAERRSELEALFGTTHEEGAGPPTRPLALAAYPNPLIESTRLSFELPDDSRVDIRVFDVLGREVVKLFEDQRIAGRHDLIWHRRDESGRRVPSGMYFVRIVDGRGRSTVRAVSAR